MAFSEITFLFVATWTQTPTRLILLLWNGPARNLLSSQWTWVKKALGIYFRFSDVSSYFLGVMCMFWISLQVHVYQNDLGWKGLCRPSSPTSSLKGQLEKLDYVAWALSTQILQSPKGVSTAFLSACFSALLSVKNFLMSDQILPTTACHSCILSSVHLCGVCLLCITSLPVVEGCS